MAAKTSAKRIRNRSSAPIRRTPIATSAERTDLALQHGPGFGAVLLLPLAIEAGALQRGIERGHVRALELGRRVEVALDDVLQVLGQRRPDTAVGERPESVPHVV